MYCDPQIDSLPGSPKALMLIWIQSTGLKTFQCRIQRPVI